MILTIDIGNSNTVLGFFKKDKLVNSNRFATDSNIAIDELTIKLSNILDFYNIKKAAIEAVIIANVVPSLNQSYMGLIGKLFKCKIYFVKDYLNKLPIKITYKNITELGDDRIVNAIASDRYYNDDLIIVDFGTAITFDVITKKDGYLGGVILPGVDLAIKYLSQQTAKLPEVSFTETNHIIGKNTVDAIENGLFHGYLAMIEGVIAKIVLELKTNNYQVISTGGIGKIFTDNSKIISEYQPDLTLQGLQILYDHINV